jgi:hypothetical protein
MPPSRSLALFAAVYLFKLFTVFRGAQVSVFIGVLWLTYDKLKAHLRQIESPPTTN